MAWLIFTLSCADEFLSPVRRDLRKRKQTVDRRNSKYFFDERKNSMLFITFERFKAYLEEKEKNTLEFFRYFIV